MKIILTGGHLSPLLAVIEALPKSAEILVIGRKYSFEGEETPSMESKILLERKIPFKTIETARWQRKFTRYTLVSLIKFPRGLIRSFFILRKFRPEIILSFGGYLSLPVVLAGFILRIPIVIHEQTLEAGFANKLESYFAKKVCLSWPESKRHFPSRKIVLTGNPINASIRKHIDLKPEGKIFNNDLPIIYITGGSSGSHTINELIKGCLQKLLDKYNLFHQTGETTEFHDYDNLSELRKTLPDKFQERYKLEKNINPDEVARVIKQADMVISRSGMNTICELILLKKPSLLIPLAFSQKNEQKNNALLLNHQGLGEVIDQDNLTPDLLFQIIEKMMNKIKTYKLKDDKAFNFLKENAAAKIIKVLQDEIKTRS